MPPEERRRTLEKLPPERRREAEERLDHLNALSPAERQALAQRYAAFQRLPLAQQQHARALFRQLRELKEEKRAPVQEAMMEMKDLEPTARAGFLRQPERRKRFDKQQRAVLEQYQALLEELPADFTGFDTPAVRK